MRLAVLSADTDIRRDIAKRIAREHALPLIAVQEGMLQKLKDLKNSKSSGALLQEMLDRQIRKQILYRDGFVSIGSTLDYVALYKTLFDMKDNGKASIPDLIKARIHAWRHLDEIIYIPVTQKGDKLQVRYDTYLQMELELVKANTCVQVVIAGKESQPPLLMLERDGANGTAIACSAKEDLGTI